MGDNRKQEKIFVIPLHRTMTRSVDAYLSILGYQPLHYPKYIQGINKEEIFLDHLIETIGPDGVSGLRSVER